MKKRKARRKQPSEDIEREVLTSAEEFEKMREMALLNLVADMIVKATLRDLYAEDNDSDNT